MKFIRLLLILTAVFIMLSNAAHAEILERDDIMGYKQEVLSKDPLIIKISGLSAHSALSVKRIYTKSEGKTITIYIKLIFAPGDYDYSGSFEYLLQIPDDIDTVQIGEKKVVFWDRTSGLITTKYKIEGIPAELVEKINGKTP